MEHFTRETTDFMWGLALNNERSWFELHRDEYEKYLKEPFDITARKVFERMNGLYPRENLMLHKARIWRDARRLFGRGPFKEHLWFSVKSSSGLLEGPMFWFEIGAKDFSYGMGYYDAPPELMALYRKRIEENPAPLAKLARAYKKQDEFVLEGAEYKRPKGDVGELLNPWYNRKYIALVHNGLPGDTLYSPALADRLTESFKRLMPYYKYYSALYDALPREY